MRYPPLVLAFLYPVAAFADPAAILDTAVNEHIRPGYDTLAERSKLLVEATAATCDREDAVLRETFNSAWDSWLRISHIRFGPSETENRAFSFGYWPDARGFIPKTLQGLIADEDPAVYDAEAFHDVSIAAHGFTALEFLLYDDAFADTGDYGCALVRAIATDIAATAETISAEWDGAYGEAFSHPAPGAPYPSEDDALTALFTSVTTALQFSAEARIGRPMGTFDRPRPTRAEAYRSGRSVRHVEIVLEGTEDLALILATDFPEDAASVATSYDRALSTLGRVEDPGFGDVQDPSGRFRVEAAQQRVNDTRENVRVHVGGPLGLAEGFNSQDGD